MSNKKSLYEKVDNKPDYIKTFLITLFIVLTFGVLNIFYMIHSIFNQDVNSRKENIDSAFEAYLVDFLIDKNKDFALKFPKNYAVNMRLGILYSYKKDYVNAEKEFKNSIEKAAAFDYTPSYQLAKLYVKIGKLKDAQSLMDNIGDKYNKRLLRFKGDIYSLIGETYNKQGYYALSLMKYEKALLYYKAIDEKLVKQTTDRFANIHISLADKYVEKGKIDEAIMALENAYELRPKNIILNYKLGLLYIDNNPKKAYELLSFVNKKEPQIINSDAYYDLTNKLADIEIQNKNYTDGELYRKKALQYRKFVKNNLLNSNDLFIDVIKQDIKADLAAQEFIVTLQFTLQNNSDLDIDNLTIYAIFKDNDNIIQKYKQKIYDDIKIFKKGEVSPPIVISASELYKNHKSGSINVDVYAYKYPKYNVKLYSTSIAKPVINQ